MLRHSRSPVLILATFCCGYIATSGAVAHANTISHDALEGFAKTFIDRLDPVYQDLNAAAEEKGHENLSRIPDGSTLLLRPRIDQYFLENDLYVIKKNGRIYFVWTDFIDEFDLPITFNEDTGTGSGWFLREDWLFNIDIPNRIVNSRGVNYKIYENDLLEEEGLLFIAGRAITRWTDIAFEYDLSQQYVTINSAYPLPGLVRRQRQAKKTANLRKENKPVLPRRPQAKALFDVQAADFSSGVRYRRDKGREASRQLTSNLAVQGQVLGQEAQISASRNSRNGLENVSTLFSSQSEDPTLLGPLNARSYQFGDITGVSIPLTGEANQALGFTATNSPLYSTNFSTTRIEGRARPDWDVELYRAGILMDTLTVTDTGRYSFDDVPLFAGDNEFKLLFYGLQGEIREETLQIPVTADLIRNQKDSYEVSVNFEDERSYQRTRSQSIDKGQPDIAVRYNTLIGGNFTYLGLRSRSQGGERENFIGGGMTIPFAEGLYDINIALDENARYSTDFSMSRGFGEWDFSTGFGLKDDDYATLGSASNPTIFDTRFRARRTYEGWIGDGGTVRVGGSYNLLSSGEGFGNATFGFSNKFGPISISEGLSFRGYNFDENRREDSLSNTFSVRGRHGRANFRGGFDYRILPTQQTDRYFAQAYYSFDSTKTVDVSLDHKPTDNFSTARLNMTYSNEYFRTSPFFEMNSDQDVRAGINVNMNLFHAAGQKLPEVTSGRVLGRGYAQAFVFLDNNGNMIFDDGDEVLPEVTIKSVNSKKRAQTNESGYASLIELQTLIATDIVLDESTLPDYFMISAYEGASILPIAGQRHNFVFPVHNAGEIEGNALIRPPSGEDIPASRLLVTLTPLDRETQDTITTQTAFDGFYLFTRVPPGRYLLGLSTPADKTRLGNPAPEIVTVGYDGTVLTNQTLLLSSTRGFVDYKVDATLATSGQGDKGDVQYALFVQSGGKSMVSNLVRKLMLQRYGRKALAQLTKVNASKADKDAGFEEYTGSRERMHDACGILSRYNINCHIRVKTTAPQTLL